MSRFIHQWFERHEQVTCSSSVIFLRKVSSDREFYDQIEDIANFMTGITVLDPKLAIKILIGVIRDLFPYSGPDQVYRGILDIVLNEEASLQELKAGYDTLRFHKAPKDQQYVFKAVSHLIQWRIGRVGERAAVRMYPRLVQQKQEEGMTQKDAKHCIISHMKKLYPYEEWVAGVERGLSL